MSGLENCGPTELDLWIRGVVVWGVICLVVVLLSSSLGATLTSPSDRDTVSFERKFEEFNRAVFLLLAVIGYFIWVGLANELLQSRMFFDEIPANAQAMVNLLFISAMWFMWHFLRALTRMLRMRFVSMEQGGGPAGEM